MDVFILSVESLSVSHAGSVPAGVESAVLEALAASRTELLTISHYREPGLGHVWMRIELRTENSAAVEAALSGRAAVIGFAFTIVAKSKRARILLLMSRFPHCALDILARSQNNELPIDVVGVMANHAAPCHLSGFDTVPFERLTARSEDQIRDRLQESGADLLVLARYTQILSPELVEALPCPAINIHHSLLPAFAGALPYSRAHGLGVRFIGATAHYVTADLDQGPIIEQDVARISSDAQVEDLMLRGREVESVVLARAIKWHLEQRVVVHGRRTIILR